MSNLALPLIVEPSELARHLGRDDLLIVDLSDRKGLTKLVRTQRCVPGAVHLDRSRIIAAQPPAMGLVPDERQLGELLSSIGLTSQTQVVAYDDLGNVHACRFLWTLDLVGHPRFSLLDGGLGAWLDEGKPRREGLPSRRQATSKWRSRTTRLPTRTMSAPASMTRVS